MSLGFRATRAGWWTNGKAFTIHNPKSFNRIIADYGSWDAEKSVSLTDSDVQTFLDGEENQNTKKETALVIAFLAAGNENRQLEDLPPADFGRVPKIFLLLLRTT